MKNFDELLKKYADFIVRVGVNPQPGQTMIIRCPLEAAPLARLCVRSGFEAGARDVQVDWSDNAVSRTRMELGSEEALTDSKPYQLRRYLDYAESEGSVCVLHLIADPVVKVLSDAAGIAEVAVAAAADPVLDAGGEAGVFQTLYFLADDGSDMLGVLAVLSADLVSVGLEGHMHADGDHGLAEIGRAHV